MTRKEACGKKRRRKNCLLFAVFVPERQAAFFYSGSPLRHENCRLVTAFFMPSLSFYTYYHVFVKLQSFKDTANKVVFFGVFLPIITNVLTNLLKSMKIPIKLG
jgi:hypothetical protein